ncbi:hypothetical protein CONPUDRAFT_51659 [Coniophora puteana RWD-64-598 SS2]|uniref:Protein kinase domain-containing protein n=1 Tax=Coniophora puteana (strain RWD-64-598) TaxID=741705 RepID=A0A5M3MW98_CONPW|nr:uncharacterized protein CONPUDRAFT_51659 [Coniophora puteana RWD-64-598 SS2]EIW83340.1 hypothetical protein CONPUDRAFT_51659 [Coniophora puteana RWD-64-598 SS2]
MFSTLTIAGGKITKLTTLTGSKDFPPHQFHIGEGEYLAMPKWCSSKCPRGAGHLSLRVGKRISGGGSGVAYEAEVLVAGSGAVESNVAVSNPSPLEQQLCIKVARPNRCRTLAREAWMYRRLRSLRGVIAPQFYGFFTAELSETQSPFPPSEDLVHLEEDDLTRDEFLPDDEPLDALGGRDRSKWCKWRPKPDAPMLAVIVMSRGGATYSQKDHWDLEDVRAVLDDLSRASILHGDLRPANIVRAPASTIPCDVYRCIHKWNVIDFARARALDVDVDGTVLLKNNRTPEEERKVSHWNIFVYLQRSSYETENFDL